MQRHVRPTLLGSSSATPDSVRVPPGAAFPSTPQHIRPNHNDPSTAPVQSRVGFSQRVTAGGAMALPPRSKSSGDLALMHPRVVARTSPSRDLGAEQQRHAQRTALYDRFVKVVEAQHRVEMRGVDVHRDGFVSAFLGNGNVKASPTDVVIHISSAFSTPPGAGLYAPWANNVSKLPRTSPTSPTTRVRATTERVTESDPLIVIPRLALAAATYYPAGSVHRGVLDNGVTPRESSIAVMHAQRGRSCLELRTKDLAVITLVFPSNSKAHEPLVKELCRPAEHNLYLLSPMRAASYLLYAATQLARRLQHPRHLIAAAAHRALVDPSQAQRAMGEDPSNSVASHHMELAKVACLAPALLPSLLLTAAPTTLKTTSPTAQGLSEANFQVAAVTHPPQGWFLFDAEAEHQRQTGRTCRFSSGSPSPERSPIDMTQPLFPVTMSKRDTSMGSTAVCLRRTDVNAQFEVCKTYPPILYIPAGIDDATFVAEAQQRARERVQVCSYFYAPTQTALFRSSQPKNGKDIAQWFIASEVSKLTDAMRNCCPSKQLKVVDLRPYANAIGNSLFRDGGYESSRLTDNIEVVFANMENVDKVNAAYQELYTFCTTNHAVKTCARSASSLPSSYLSSLSKMSWLDLLSICVNTAVKVARFLVRGHNGDDDHHHHHQRPSPAGSNVLIHCSDGWDRTAQISALVQLLLDPYLRTLRGFCMLVEKEFVHFGHQFRSRSHHPWVSSQGSGKGVDAAVYPLYCMKAAAVETAAEKLSELTPPRSPVPETTDLDNGWDAVDPHPNPPSSSSCTRCAESVKAGGGGHAACPVFLQFIDAVRLLVEIYPSFFELTEDTLLWIVDAYHSGYYATFCADSYRELITSGLVGKHTANALAEVAALGGVYPPPTPSVTPVDTSHKEDREGTPGSFVEIDTANLDDSVQGRRESPNQQRLDPSPPDTSLCGPLVNPTFDWFGSVAVGPLLGLIAPGRVTLWARFFLRYSDPMEPITTTLRAPIPPELQSAAQRARSASLRAAASSESLADGWASTGGSAVTSPATHVASSYPPPPASHSPLRQGGPPPAYPNANFGLAQSYEYTVDSPLRAAATRRHGPVNDMAPLPPLLSRFVADFE